MIGRCRLLCAVALAAIVALPMTYAEDNTASQPSIVTAHGKGDLVKLTIVSGRASLNENDKQTDATPLDKLPREVAYVAAHFKNATFASNGRTLVVGLAVKGVKDGTTLAAFNWRSDCANNSQFTPDAPAALEAHLPKAELKSALIAWTQHRHNAKTAPVLNFNESRAAAGYSDFGEAQADPGSGTLANIDVQLNLKAVAVSAR